MRNAKIRRVEPLAEGEATKAIVSLSRLKGRKSDISGFSVDETFISTPAVSHCALGRGGHKTITE